MYTLANYTPVGGWGGGGGGGVGGGLRSDCYIAIFILVLLISSGTSIVPNLARRLMNTFAFFSSFSASTITSKNKRKSIVGLDY